MPGVKFISRATSDSFVGSNDIRLAAATIDGAARLNATAAIADTLYSVSTANTNAFMTASVVRTIRSGHLTRMPMAVASGKNRYAGRWC